MVSSHIKRNMDLLRYLAKANRKSLPVVNAIIKTADKSLIDSLCECSLNTLCGNVPLKPTEKRRLRCHKDKLRTLASKKTSITRKRRALQSGGFLSSLLVPALTILGSLLVK